MTYQQPTCYLEVPMSTKRISVVIPVHEGEYLIAEWHGGAYIDLRRAANRTPSEVINVWDDEADKASIPFTRDALRQAVLAWITVYADNEGAAALAYDMRNSW